MNYEEIADAIDDLVALLPDVTHEQVISALAGDKLISGDDADELRELLK